MMDLVLVEVGLSTLESTTVSTLVFMLEAAMVLTLV